MSLKKSHNRWCSKTNGGFNFNHRYLLLGTTYAFSREAACLEIRVYFPKCCLNVFFFVTAKTWSAGKWTKAYRKRRTRSKGASMNQFIIFLIIFLRQENPLWRVFRSFVRRFGVFFFLLGPSRTLAPVIKCRRFLSFYQRYVVRDHIADLTYIAGSLGPVSSTQWF